MGSIWLMARVRTRLIVSTIRPIIFIGLIPALQGCYVGQGGAAVDPGPRPPKAPQQIQFACHQTISWQLPTEREGGAYLPPFEIKFVTLLAARMPSAPRNELAFIMDLDPHLLQWRFTALDPGTWYFRLTATDNDGRESKMSSETSNEACG